MELKTRWDLVATWIRSRIDVALAGYAVLVGVVAVVFITAIGLLGHSAPLKFTPLGNSVSRAGP